MMTRSMLRPIYPIIVGLLFFLATIVSIVRTYHWNATAVTTSGRVVELRPEIRTHKHGPSDTVYRAIVEYAADDANARLVTSKVASSTGENAVGDAVTVSYLPDQPGEARIDDDDIWGSAKVLALFGGVAFLYALVSAFRRM